jgi:hypothetical protein
MPLDKDDWLYVGGAAAGGVLVGVLVKSLLTPSAEPIHTGLARTYSSEKASGTPVTAMVWALPGGGYTITLQRPDGEPAFPDMKLQTFTSPLTSAMWADGIMADLGWKSDTDWAPLVNEAAEARMRERRPAIAGRRRR